ncbi:MAG: prepilin-type N-terminal cleavage/methylation domain-containing protein, partial [Pirellulales bacterium]
MRRGFSLAEVVVGSAVLAMFMLATPLAIRMASQGVPDGKNTASAAVDASRAMEVVASDLAFATSVSSKTSASLTFTVPDRNGDGQPETIQYYWTAPAAGQPLAPLFRQYNGSAPAAIAKNVQEFSLVYDTRPVSSSTTTTGAETVVFSADTGRAFGSNPVASNSWEGEFFQPVLPANALSWNLTRVELNVQKGQVLDQASVQIWKAAGQYPDSIVLDTSPQNASTALPSMTTVSFPFANLGNLSPSASLFVVVTSSDSKPACLVQQCGGSGGLGGRVHSPGTASNWATDPGHDLCVSVYGTVNTPGTTNTLYYLTDVRCTLRTNA